MNFESFLSSGKLILTEGSIYERLRRFPNLKLDAHIANASLVYNPDAAAILKSVVEDYIAIADRYNLPIVTLTNTWRANKDRIAKSEFADREVNTDCAHFYRQFLKQLNNQQPVFLGGLMGCRGDAYKPEEGLSSNDSYAFHSWQAEQLKNAGVDFLFASTLPALEEAKGLAKAMSETGSPYILSFVIRGDGTLLDGTLLAEAVRQIDQETAEPPLRYMINCSHSSAFRAAYPLFESVSDRIAGLQANTSARDPRELDGVAELETEEPQAFATAMRKLREDFRLQMLGGCCGTDGSHIEALAKELNTLG